MRTLVYTIPGYPEQSEPCDAAREQWLGERVDVSNLRVVDGGEAAVVPAPTDTPAVSINIHIEVSSPQPDDGDEL